MTDLGISLVTSAVLIVGIAIISLAALRGWSQWIALRRFEFEALQGDNASGSSAMGDQSGQRIEIADLRERVKKLEAIAAGVDL